MIGPRVFTRPRARGRNAGFAAWARGEAGRDPTYRRANHAKLRGKTAIITGATGGISISKHAFVGLVRTAALEGAASNVRVYSIHPGPIANRMMDSLEQQMSPQAQAEARANLERMVAMGRYGTNEEIAKLALFLASDDSSYCTGQTFVADGGFVAQ